MKDLEKNSQEYLWQFLPPVVEQLGRPLSLPRRRRRRRRVEGLLLQRGRDGTHRRKDHGRAPLRRRRRRSRSGGGGGLRRHLSPDGVVLVRDVPGVAI